MKSNRQATDYDPLLHFQGGNSSSSKPKRDSAFTGMHVEDGQSQKEDSSSSIDMTYGRLSSSAQAIPYPYKSKRRKHGPFWFIRQIVISVAFFGTLGLLGFLAYVGFTHNGNNCDQPLALFLMVDSIGCAVLVTIVVVVTYMYNNWSDEWADWIERFHLNVCIRLLTFVAITAWNVIGSIWTYTLDLKVDTDCDSMLYDSCWWTLTIIWGIMAGSIALVILAAICLGLCYCISEAMK